MKLLIVLSAVVAVSFARPGYLPGGLAGLVGIAAPLTISAQHHAQDVLGQYNYGYIDSLSAKGEVRTADGVTRGGYSYVDANGQIQNVAYTADAANGFRVTASNLPQAPATPDAPAPEPVQDTPEVSAARAAHFAAVAQAGGATPDAAPAGPPQPPQDTPEVASAKAAHAVAHAVAAANAGAAPAVRFIATAPGLVALGPAGGFAYSSVAAAPLYSGLRVVAPTAPVVLTAQGVPVDTPEVQAARAADAIAHLQAKANLLG